MNAVYVLILGLIVVYLGYRVYAKYIDEKVIQADPKRVTPAKMYMDGVEFMPTPKSILYGFQFKSIAGAGPIVGPIIAIQWGWLPAVLWILLGALFIGWVHDYASAIIVMRNDGASFGGLSHRLISPRARIILLAFIYFYLLLCASAFGAIVAGTCIKLKAAPMAWLFLTGAGVLAGQMIYRWRRDIILTTVVTVLIALGGVWVGSKVSTDSILGVGLSNSTWLWAIVAFAFCYVSAVLPIWCFALPINYVAAYIVFFGLFFGCIGILVLRPEFTLPAFQSFEIGIGPLWPIMFVTLACGAISGWHSIVSSSGTARQLESELDARPVGAGVMFLEMMLALFALVIAGTLFSSMGEYAAALKQTPAAVFAAGVSKFLGVLGLPGNVGNTYGSMMMIFLAITLMQLQIRFMRVATSELLGPVNPIFKNVHVGTIIACLLGMLLVFTGWWQYLWIVFGGANQLMASLALLLISAWLVSEGRPSSWAFYPMIFMFVTTVAALLYTSHNLLVTKALAGAVKGPDLIGNILMGIVALFLVVAALVIGWEGYKAFRRLREVKAATAAVKA